MNLTRIFIQQIKANMSGPKLKRLFHYQIKILNTHQHANTHRQEEALEAACIELGKALSVHL